MTDRPLRVMWLLNHTTARKFEIPMLKRIGVQEIFLPKKMPADPSFRSGSIDYSEDAHLTVPKDELDLLNAADWYDDPGVEAWQIASKHFDAAFFILWRVDFLKSMSRHFTGEKIWRTYGLSHDMTYSKVLDILSQRGRHIWKLSSLKNFWFGQAYPQLAKQEPLLLQKNAVFLPAGLGDTDIRDEWRGADPRLFFVCPDLAFNEYYQDVYRQFKKTFGDLPYVVGGAQPITVRDPHVLGYLPIDQHRQNMRELRVMFYHSTEPNHVHYHPFEAVRSGMPLVFMAGGLIDTLGGSGLPGRCKTLKEARQKVERILAGDRGLIDDIRRSQPRLLDPMKAENCEADWRAGLQLVLGKLKEGSSRPATRSQRKRIAVIVPVGYRGGSLRGAKLLARALALGSEANAEDVEVVFGHLDDPACYPNEGFDDLPASIKQRPFFWRIVDREESIRARVYGGLREPLTGRTYMVPDDGINQFMDCDLWILVSDRLNFPLLPVRPYLLMVYDYVQRYENLLDDETNQKFVNRAHDAEAVMVTTNFTADDARQFAGIPATKIKKVPMLAPEFSKNVDLVQDEVAKARFFIWTTNLGPHKNHENAFKALRLYYEKHGGMLECRVTGVDTKDMLKRDVTHLKTLREIRRSSSALKQHLKIEGELPDQSYQAQLRGAAFLWHAGRVDNGTFSVVEAAHFGVPSLSSDYPAMREIDQQFALHLTWMDPNDPNDMAHQLKRMEADLDTPRSRLPSTEQLANHSVEKLAGAYWSAVRNYL